MKIRNLVLMGGTDVFYELTYTIYFAPVTSHHIDSARDISCDVSEAAYVS